MKEASEYVPAEARHRTTQGQSLDLDITDPSAEHQLAQGTPTRMPNEDNILALFLTNISDAGSQVPCERDFAREVHAQEKWIPRSATQASYQLTQEKRKGSGKGDIPVTAIGYRIARHIMPESEELHPFQPNVRAPASAMCEENGFLPPLLLRRRVSRLGA